MRESLKQAAMMAVKTPKTVLRAGFNSSGGQILGSAIVGAIFGSFLFPPFGTILGAFIGGIIAIVINKEKGSGTI